MIKHFHHQCLMVFFLPGILARGRENETAHLTTRTSLAPLKSMKDKLKPHIIKHHGRQETIADSGYYNEWTRVLTSDKFTASNYI